MATRSQPQLLAQGKPRTLGGSTRPWRVRLYAPAPGSNKYQVYFKAPAGEGEPWKRVLRRAASEEEARKDERQRRASQAAREKDRSLAWWNYPVPPEDELWLFVDTMTGLPVKPEMHNERWHRVRRWVEANDPDNAWPKTIVYRNLRHHAVTKWFHEKLGEP